MKAWEEIRDRWLVRLKSETDLTTRLMEKLRAANSFPEAMTAYQEWMNRRMELFAEDSRRFGPTLRSLWKPVLGSSRNLALGCLVSGPMSAVDTKGFVADQWTSLGSTVQHSIFVLTVQAATPRGRP
jgi:hypothetical protein